ncbi:MAG: ArgE/DapE family deacylase [Deltaproteobacteria bacterium]|nr:ArgE/DapE family deacylase [Deltaproteobacteria bacterium]
MDVDEVVTVVSAEIEKRSPEFLEFAADMIKVPSFNPPGNYEKIAPLVVERLASFGLQAKEIITPPELVAQAGFEFPRRNVLATLPGASPKNKAVLMVHLDTVPVEDESLWEHEPFSGKFDDGRLWGRGACDCKGRLACFALALGAIKSAGVVLQGDAVLAATADEEIGGELGAGYLAAQGELDCDFCIVEGFINQMFHGYGGSLSAQITTIGKSAHTAVPWRGVNAIEKMQEVLRAVGQAQIELESRPSVDKEMRFSTLNIGTISGGSKSTIVPDRCAIEIDGRLATEDHPDFVIELLRKKLSKASLDNPDLIFEMEINKKEEAYVSDPDSDLVNCLQESIRLIGMPTVPVTMSRGGSDMKYMIARGIPCVAYGPGHRPNSNIHGVNENIALADFVNCAKATAVTLINLLGIT